MFNEDTTVEVIEEEETTTTSDEDQTETRAEKDWKAEALKYKAILDRKAKKAEAAPAPQSDGFGYDVKAYLKASGIKAAEFDFVQTEFKNSGIKDIDSLLENEYFQAKLEKQRELQKTQDAIPTGKGSTAPAIDSVDYWLTKPISEVPNHLRRDVVNAKLAQDKNKSKFYNS